MKRLYMALGLAVCMGVTSVSVNAIGMSAPFSVGAAPQWIDGRVYVAVDYFSMFTDGPQISTH